MKFYSLVFLLSFVSFIAYAQQNPPYLEVQNGGDDKREVIMKG